MSQITAVIESVTKKDLDGGKTVYTVTADGKKYTTFKSDVATAAKALQGQTAEIARESKQKGEYTNWYINGARPVQAAAVIPNTPDDKAESIARAVALKAAVDFQAGKGSVADVKLAANEFLAWLTGAAPVKAADIDDDASGIPF